MKKTQVDYMKEKALEEFQNEVEKTFWKAVYLACIAQNNVGDEVALEMADSAVEALRNRK